MTVHTWRPAGDFINFLRRFFTGGTYELEDISYSGIPQNHQDICLQKSNLKTVPSGSVKIKLNVVQQTFKNQEDLRSELNRNRNNRGSNPEEVLAQFRAARERMIQTKNVLSEWNLKKVVLSFWIKKKIKKKTIKKYSRSEAFHFRNVFLVCQDELLGYIYHSFSNLWAIMYSSTAPFILLCEILFSSVTKPSKSQTWGGRKQDILANFLSVI